MRSFYFKSQNGTRVYGSAEYDKEEEREKERDRKKVYVKKSDRRLIIIPK